jgi:DNA-binding response OmpR family regulator
MSKRVLIIEDDLGIVAYWTKLFSMTDKTIKVETTSDEIEARLMIESSIRNYMQYDFILSDIFLNDHGNGLEIWKSFHNRLTSSVLIMSTINREEMERMLGDKVSSPLFIQKPVDIVNSMLVVKAVTNDL